MILIVVRLLALTGLAFGLWQVAVAGLSSLARVGLGSMAVAAAVGQVRGDLWADAAKGDDGTRANDQAKLWAADALRTAPLRSDMWLRLAAGAHGGPDDAAADHPTPLLMAYMVGSGKRGEWPERFTETLQSSSLGDETLASFFRTDLALALKFRPDAAARVKAALTGRDAAFVAAVKDVDPSLVGK